MTVNINPKKVAIVALSMIVLSTLAFGATQAWDWKKATEAKIADQSTQIVSLKDEVKTKTEAIASKDQQITDLGGKVANATKEATTAKGAAATANKNLAAEKQVTTNLNAWIVFLADLGDNLNGQRKNYRAAVSYLAQMAVDAANENWTSASQNLDTARYYTEQAAKYDGAIDSAMNQLENL